MNRRLSGSGGKYTRSGAGLFDTYGPGEDDTDPTDWVYTGRRANGGTLCYNRPDPAAVEIHRHNIRG